MKWTIYSLFVIFFGFNQWGTAQNCACEDPLYVERNYCQNMESLNTGSFIDQVNPSWTSFYSNSDVGTITNQRSFDGNKSLRFNDGTDLLHHINANDNLGIHRVEWRSYFERGAQMTYGMIYQLSSQDWAYRVNLENGRATIRLGRTSQTVVAEHDYSENKWIQIVNIINSNTGDVEIWIDGAFVTAFDYRDGTNNPLINRNIDALNIWDAEGTGRFYLDKYCYRELLRNPPICNNIYDPVCVVDKEFRNECYAQNAGYTDNEWIHGPCGQYDPCSDCGGCFDYYFDHHDPEIIHCTNNYCDDNDDAPPYFWQVKSSSGQSVNPDFVFGDAHSESPSMRLPKGTYTICLSLDYAEYQSELCCITVIIVPEPCYRPPTCGIDVADDGNGEYSLRAFGDDVDGYEWVFPEEISQGQNSEGEFSSCSIPWGKCYTVCLYAYNDCGMTYNCITLCNTSACSYPEVIPVPTIDLFNEETSCEVVGMGALVDLNELYTYEWVVPSGVEVGSNGNDDPADIPKIHCPGPGSYKICLIVKIGNCYTLCYCWNIKFPGNTDCLTFDVAEVSCASPGSSIDIPIYVSDFENISSFQYTLEIADGNTAQFQGSSPVSSTVLGGTLLSARISNTIATVTWNSTSGQAVSLPNGSKALDVKLRLTGSDGDRSDIVINSSRTEIYAEDENQRSICVETLLGNCCIEASYEIYGNVRTVDGRGIKDVSMYLDINGQPVEDKRTNSVGYYEFDNLNNQAYRIHGRKNLNVKNGLNVGDMLRTLDHILTVNQFDLPFQYLAADVDRDGKINTGDAAEIQRVVGAVNTSFSEVDSWLILPAEEYDDLSIQDVLDHNYLDYSDVLVNRSVTLDFTGIKMGDVTNSADPQKSSGQTGMNQLGNMELSIDNTLGKDGESVWVSVRVDEFSDIRGFQFTIVWDDLGLKLEDIENFNSELDQLDVAVQQINENSITCVWGGTSGVSLNEDDVLFTLKYNLSGEIADRFDIRFDNQPTEILYVDVDFNESIPNMLNGSVTVANTSSNAEVETDDFNVFPNPFISQIEVFSSRSLLNLEYNLVDVNGRIIRSGKFEQEHKLPLSQLNSGVYYLSIFDDQKLLMIKPIVKSSQQ